MSKLDKKISILTILVIILMLSSCKQIGNMDSIYPSPTVVEELSADDSSFSTVENEKSFNAKEKLQHTKSYLLYDENTSSATVELYLKDVSSFKKYDKVICYNGNNLVTDKVTVYGDMKEYLLKFDIEEYIEYFDRIELISGNNSEFINIGKYYIEKIEKDTLKEKEWLILDAYEKEDGINKFKATFSLNGDDKNYSIDCQIPNKLKKLNILQYTYSYENSNIKFECEIPKENFTKLNLYSIEFDMAIVQSDNKDGKKYKILKCFIPLIKS